jgi:hypothetical protein|mmetsp:Transcript_29508/g.54074  ORF Transcript_29508/g.54074 Transcript_29508/m.54074 type:complete len:93 (+) Transcript_29508:72-350(+)
MLNRNGNKSSSVRTQEDISSLLFLVHRTLVGGDKMCLERHLFRNGINQMYMREQINSLILLALLLSLVIVFVAPYQLLQLQVLSHQMENQGS